MVYKIAPGAHIKTPAAIVGQVSETLEKTEEGLTPQTLLNASRPADAPLYKEYEWDDSKAAAAYRLSQSRYILRSLVIVPDEQKPTETIRAVFTVAEGKYQNVQTIIAAPETRDALLQQALRDLQSVRKKYNALSELTPLWTAMDEIEQIALAV